MSRSDSVRWLSAAVFFSLLLLQTSPASSQNQQSATGDTSKATSEPSPVLVELFTSEGCSSCPPADIMLQKLDEFQPIPGANLIVLSEHVTYWDQQGWKDPNSSQPLTDRQAAYESALGEKTVYTPQIIVGGNQLIRLNQTQDQMTAIFQKASAEAKVSVRIGEVTVEPGKSQTLRTHIETGENLDKHNADVYVALALDHVESQVLRGENGGKHLVHVAVVRQLTKVGKLPKGKNFSQDVQLKLGEGIDPKDVRLIAFVQDSGPGKVLGSAMRKPGNSNAAATAVNVQR
jgi:hypothetical protein